MIESIVRRTIEDYGFFLEETSNFRGMFKCPCAFHSIYQSLKMTKIVSRVLIRLLSPMNNLSKLHSQHAEISFVNSIRGIIHSKYI